METLNEKSYAPVDLLAVTCETSTREPISLLTMLRFYATAFAIVHGNLQRAEVLIALEGSHSGFDDTIPEYAIAQVNIVLQDAERESMALPVSHSFREQIKRLRERVEREGLSSEQHRHVVIALLQEVARNFLHEMADHYYLLIPSDRRNLFVQSKSIFGDEVISQFPAAARDIADAGRCLALDQWTAAVFHLMRVLEHGLRALAELVNATFPVSVELEHWKNIIDAIEKKIKDMEQQPKTLQKSADLEFYGKLATQFWFFKEAWRNHVAHLRGTYDEREAVKVFNAVRDFMQQLASHRKP